MHKQGYQTGVGGKIIIQPNKQSSNQPRMPVVSLDYVIITVRTTTNKHKTHRTVQLYAVQALVLCTSKSTGSFSTKFYVFFLLDMLFHISYPILPFFSPSIPKRYVPSDNFITITSHTGTSTIQGWLMN